MELTGKERLRQYFERKGETHKLEQLSESAKMVKDLEKRCQELEEKLKKASGWANKEVVRKSLKTNMEMLEKAREIFWKENL